LTTSGYENHSGIGAPVLKRLLNSAFEQSCIDETTRSRDVHGFHAIWHLVFGHVLVDIGEICHLLEGNNFNSKFIAIFFHHFLSIIRPIKVDSLVILARTGVIPTDNEVSSTVVLADNGMPNSLTWTTHSHRKRQQRQNGHSVGVPGHNSLVYTDPGVVVDVSGLGKTDDWMDEDVGLVRSRCADREFTMGSVHGISRLEGDDTGPMEFRKVSSELGGGDFSLAFIETDSEHRFSM